MSSIITHLGISTYLKEKYNFTNDFLVGSIAPDVIKRLPYTNRDNSHYIKEYNENGQLKRLPNIDKFLKENINEDSDYFYGYLSHLLQDKIWFDKYVPMCANNPEEKYVTYIKDHSTHLESEFSEEMYKDYSSIDAFVLSKININLNNIKEETKKYFNKDDISNIVDKYIKIYDIIENRENCFLTYEMIENYFEDCKKICEEYISERKK